MTTQFAGLKKRFAALVASFSDWAKAHEEKTEEKIKTLQSELAALEDKLSDIDTATLGATLGITGVIAGFSGPFAPIVMVRGVWLLM
jgi:hypothetical protein